MNVDLNPELTPNESAAIAEGIADDEAARVAAAGTAAPAAEVESAVPAAAPAPAIEAAPASDTTATALSAAADRLAGAAEALAAAAPAPAATPAAAVAPARDFNAEHVELQRQFDDGDLEQAEHSQKLRALTLEEADARTATALAKAREEDAASNQQRNEQAAEAAWSSAQTRFFTDPGNAALVADPIRKAGFEAAVTLAFQEGAGALSWDEVLAKAREKVTGVAPVAETAAVAQATRDRAAAQVPAPPSLRDAPSAGAAVDAAPGAGLDNLDISDLEDRLALMTPQQRAQYLADAPGGLTDNPRG